MTYTVKQDTAGNYSIRIEQDKYMSGYKVVALERVETSICDPFYRECNCNVYPSIEQANKRFNYLKRQAISGNL